MADYENTKRRVRNLETIRFPVRRLTGKKFSVGTVAKYKMPDTLLFDENNATYWESKKDSAIVGYELDTARVLRNFRYAPRKGFESRILGSMVQGSNDNKEWFTIYTIPKDALIVYDPLSVYDVVLDNEHAYKWLRVKLPDNSYGNFSEIEFLGY